MAPPLVLVCLSCSADCYGAFRSASHFGIHVAGAEDVELAKKFARKGGDKFEGAAVRRGAGEIPVLSNVGVLLECTMHAQYDGGDHRILIGKVVGAQSDQDTPLVYFRKNFHSLSQSRID